MLTVHSGLVPLLLAQGPGPRALVARVASAYGKVVAVNDFVGAALRGCGVPGEKLAIVPAWAGPGTPGEAPPGFAAARLRYQPLLACAVAPSPIYGLRVLLPALRLAGVRRPTLGAVLFGPEAAPGRVAEAAREACVGDRVRYLGELGHANALAVMAASDVFLRPTLADGDALSVREALGLGTPVVASAVGFRPPGTRLFRPGDERGLAHAVEEALAGPRPMPAEARGLEAILSIYDEARGAKRAAG